MNDAQTVQPEQDRPEPHGLLAGKVALVSGVGPDLGRAMAVRSARAGADVVLAARDGARLNEIADEIKALGRRALPVPTDVTDANARSELVSAALAEFSGVDVLFNCAFSHPPKDLINTDLED